MDPLFGIDVSQYYGLVYVTLSGEIDLTNHQTIRDQVKAYLDLSTTTGLVIDLAGVTFLGSSGISMLVACRQAAQDLAIPFGAIRAQGMTRRVLDTVGVSDYLNTDEIILPCELR